jgi:hypothetical protein
MTFIEKLESAKKSKSTIRLTYQSSTVTSGIVKAMGKDYFILVSGFGMTTVYFNSIKEIEIISS